MAIQWTIGDKIALFALFITMLPLFDLVQRKITIPEIEVLPPPQVDFRTSDVVRKRNKDGRLLAHPDGSPAISESETENKTTYVIIPLSYINRGDTGEDFLIPLEKLHLKLGEDSFMYKAFYSTTLVSKPSESWLGNPWPRLPAVLEGGGARSDEVVFVPQDKESAIPWTEFINKLKEQQKDATIEIRLEVVTLSGKVFQSLPCQLSVNHLLTPFHKTSCDRLSYYRTHAECKAQTG